MFRDKKCLMEQLEEIQSEGMNNGYDEELKQKEKSTLEQLNARKRQEEIYWKQKSCNQWL